MKKNKSSPVFLGVALFNPVAKFAHKSNRSFYFEDKTRYNRKKKHKFREDTGGGNTSAIHVYCLP